MGQAQKPYRQLTNPPARLEIPQDFPALMDYAASPLFLRRVLTESASRLGAGFKGDRCIHIAYPHKSETLHPRHYNAAIHAMKEMLKNLRAAGFEPVALDAIHDTKHLARSERAPVAESIAEPQVYGVDCSVQKQNAPFLRQGGQGSHVILVDSGYDQGTTLASLYSYIAHNGGKVLGAFIPTDNRSFRRTPYLQQKSSCAYSFNAASYGPCVSLIAEKLSELGCADPLEEIKILDGAMKKFGRSLRTMTGGEMRHMLDRILFAEDVENLVASLEARYPFKVTAPAYKENPSPR